MSKDKVVIYKFKVDNAMFETEQRFLTGREILTISNNVPPERFRLDKKMKGGKTEKIELTTIVDLSEPGLEKFMTTPYGPQEG